MITRLRECEGDPVDELVTYLSNRTTDVDRWPDNLEWRRNWVTRGQYRTARQPRLRYILEAIETAKHTALSEDIVFMSALTIEHVMPQNWHGAWPLPGMEGLSEQEYPPELAQQVRVRNSAVDVLGNLTLMTQALNSTVSNGPLSVKVAAIKANAALALNRELCGLTHWDESAIQERGEALFEIAQSIWVAPQRTEIAGAGNELSGDWANLQTRLPPDGTQCRFTYAGSDYVGLIAGGSLVVTGVEGKHTSFSAASRAVTGTNRNGWHDWYLNLEGLSWVLANEWRKGLASL